jgi:hypothetical protein
MATACQWLGGARIGETWFVEAFSLLIPLVFPDTGALLKGIRVMQNGARYPKNQRLITGSVFDKCLIYVDVTPNNLWVFDTRFALSGIPGA